MENQNIIPTDVILRNAHLTLEEIKNANKSDYDSFDRIINTARQSHINASLKNISTNLKKQMQKISFSSGPKGDIDLKSQILKSLKSEGKVDNELIKEVEGLPDKIADLHDPDTTMEKHPLFKRQVKAAIMQRLCEIGEIPKVDIDNLLKTEISHKAFDARRQIDLIEKKNISEDQAKTIKFIIGLYEFFLEDMDLTEKIYKGRLLKVENIRGTAELSKLSINQWVDLLKETNHIPEKELKAWAEKYQEKTEKLYPDRSFYYRLKNSFNDEPIDSIYKIDNKIAKEYGFEYKCFTAVAFTKKFKNLQNKGQKEYLQKVQLFINSYPNLELAKILNTKKPFNFQIKREIQKRIKIWEDFINTNIDKPFLSFDYAAQIKDDECDIHKLDFGTLKKGQISMVFKNLKSYQRVYRVCKSVPMTLMLIQNGLYSAAQISQAEPQYMWGFSGDFDKYFGQIKCRAQQIAMSAASIGASILDYRNGSIWDLLKPTSQAIIEDYLKKIDGYEYYFGNLDFCNCKKCQSILSPAAYFVDLLSFIESRIVNKPDSISEDHDLYLKNRRPDLWKLPLTCNNTHNLVPYLTIINEILENFIAISEGFDENNVYFPDNDELYSQGRRTIEDHVYGILKTLESNIHQPFHLALEELKSYLSHYGGKISPHKVSKTLQGDYDELIRTFFYLSTENLDLITTPKNLPFLKTLFDFYFQLTGTTVDPVDVKVFLKALDIDREDLGDIINSHFIAPSVAEKVTIIAEKQDPVNDVQNNVEKVYKLTTAHLDRIHRFARLYKTTSWTVKELDLLLSHLTAENLITGIHGTWIDGSGISKPGTLYYLIHLQQFRDKYNAHVEQLLPIIHRFSLISSSQVKEPFFDQLFNGKQFTDTDGTFPNAATKFIHSRYLGTAAPANVDYSLQRLLSGLKIDSDGLFTLIEYLKTPLNLDANNGFLLSNENITLLYRHVQCANWFNLSLEDLFRLISLSPENTNAYIADFPDFLILHHFQEWLNSIFSEQVLGPEDILSKYDAIINSNFTVLNEENRPETILNTIKNKIAEFNPFLFTDLELTNILGIDISILESKEIINLNSGIFLTTDENLLYLVDSYDFQNITLPPSLQPHEQGIKDHLRQFHISQLLPKYLANELGMSWSSVVELIRFTGEDYASPNLQIEMKGSTATNELLPLVQKIVRLALIFNTQTVTPELIRFVYDNPTAILFDYNGVSSIDYLGIDHQRLDKILRYKAFFPKESDLYSGDELIILLTNFTTTNKFRTTGPANDLEIIKNIFDKEITMSNVLASKLSGNALIALSQLKELNDYSSTLSVPVDSIGLMVSTDYDELKNAGLAVLGGFRKNSRDEDAYIEKIEPFIDAINILRRDALINYLLINSNLEFDSTSELYAHFLIDVEMGGCAKTSRIVAAISSLQLYVHRCLMNLEMDEGSNILAMLNDQERSEWSWRRNYRVWEANRKVFLFPENFIEPNLRHNKSPLFQELEEELLQKEITQQNVFDAYSKYMKGFEEIVNLKVVGVYHEYKSSTEYTLHFIGLGDDDPIQYYYRKVEKMTNVDNLIWNPWQKIQVEIPVKNAVPVVFNNNLYIFWNEIQTQPRSNFVSGNTSFDGYHHKMSVFYIKRKLDDTWSPIQRIFLKSETANLPTSIFSEGAEGIILDPLESGKPKYDLVSHTEAKDGYTLSGFHWEKVLPDIISGGFKGNNIMMASANWNIWHLIDLYKSTIRSLDVDFDTNTLLSGWAGQEFFSYKNTSANPNLSDYALVLRKSDDYVTFHKRELFIDEDRREKAENHWTTGLLQINENEVVPTEQPDLQIKFNASDVQNPQFTIINGRRTGMIVHSETGNYIIYNKSGVYNIDRINTTALDQISHTLFSEGFTGLLDTNAQEALNELVPILPNTDPILSINVTDAIDYSGAMGVYFKEIYFHIPFLIANHLNSQQNFEEAQKWYHFIFDPTGNANLNASDTDQERAEKLFKRVWRYADFRHMNIDTFRDMLTDNEAIELYKRFPFNPHAISDTRFNAYQKSILMKYVDNLLDWGDFLFRQDKTESINEASLLYTLASDILGERPVEIGECSPGILNPKNYEKIMNEADISSEFLYELEHYAVASDDPSDGTYPNPVIVETIGSDVLRQTPVFCIPHNQMLLYYWDRVEKSLNNIRNCMNISGVRRQIPLFAPEIDPALLVQAIAQGLSIEDVINALASNPPPYRFTYLLAIAKSYASSLQQFGSALLSAIEKKDNEELSKLRVIHEKNVLALSKSVNDKEIESAQESLNSLYERRKIIEYRVSHFTNLINNGENKFENEQRNAQKKAFISRERSQIMSMIASISHLVPQMGAPTAITFGGNQLGSSFNAMSGYYMYQATQKDFEAASAGLEAGFSRRKEEWEHQLSLASKELSQIKKEIRVSEIRLEIAKENVLIYNQNVAQNQELYNFYRGKFTSIGLYTYLSKSLQSIYRQAYNVTLSMAKLAEQAYHSENEDTNIYIGTNYWDHSYSGFLAGEKLSVDLQKMENYFFSNNFRKMEITQSFSLLRLNPEELLNLKIAGECDFEIPEIAFDLYYPGQFRRKIKSVRLTIPCVTGPYHNVSATLSLKKNEIRHASNASLVRVPNSFTSTIAASSAQNDTGQFELSFRDEQYAPFEGAGAISAWNLKLPKTYRIFDYKTISDVLITLHYTAEYSETLRIEVEDSTGAALRSIRKTMIDPNYSMFRLINLKYDLAYEYQQLIKSPINTEVKVNILENYFPIFMTATNISLGSVRVLVETFGQQSIQNFSIDINNTSAQETTNTALSLLHSFDLTAAFSSGIFAEHNVKILNFGDIADATGTLIDQGKLANIYLLIEYRML